MLKTGDMVVPVSNPNATPAEVISIDDLGHGEGNERVKIQLPILGLCRFYAMKELETTNA